MAASCKRPLYPLCPSLRCVFYQQQGRSDKALKSLTSYRAASLAELERSKTQNKSINCSPTASVSIRNIREKQPFSLTLSVCGTDIQEDSDTSNEPFSVNTHSL